MTTQYIAYSSKASAGGGVTSLNTLTGAVTLAAGSGLTITPSGNTLTIAANAPTPTAWGTITGTLSNQLDLQAALDAKAGLVELGIMGVSASFTGQLAGMTTPVTITANWPGLVGNSIELNGIGGGGWDGGTTINQSITDWNSSNPIATVILTSGDGTQIPNNSALPIDLSGGTDSGADLIGVGQAQVQYAITSSTVQGHLEGINAAINGLLPGTIPAGYIFVGQFSGPAIGVETTGDLVVGVNGVTTIQPNAVDNSKLAAMATLTIKGNNTGSASDPLDLSVSDVNTMLGAVTALAAVGSSPNANGGVISGTTLTLEPADATNPGVLTAADWNTFNNKQAALTIGNLTDVGTDGITVTGGTGAVIGSGTSLSQHVADTTHNGYLSSTDWNTFNGKQAAGNYITALTGDASASGPGSAALTLATVNANVGSFGSASSVAALTVNGKGLVTAAASTSIQISESQVTNLTTDLAAKQSTTLTSAHILVGNVSNVAADVAMSGAISIDNAGATAYAGTVPLNKGGTGQTTKAPAFDALSPMSAGGDLIYGGASGTGTRLANGSAGQVLVSGGGTAAPVWTTSARTINAQTGTSYTFVLSDGSGVGGQPLVTASNALAQTYTVPPNSSVAYPIGTQIDVIQLGAGKVTLAQGAGVTINSVSSNKSISAQYVGVSLVQTATDVWVLIGNLIA